MRHLHLNCFTDHCNVGYFLATDDQKQFSDQFSWWHQAPISGSRLYCWPGTFVPSTPIEKRSMESGLRELPAGLQGASQWQSLTIVAPAAPLSSRSDVLWYPPSILCSYCALASDTLLAQSHAAHILKRSSFPVGLVSRSQRHITHVANASFNQCFLVY